MQPLPPPTPPPKQPALNGFFAKLQADQSGFLSLLVVLGIGVLASYVLWVPFAQPAKAITDAFGDKNCATLTPGTSEMRRCAATVALWKMTGPLVLAVAVFLLRKRLSRLIGKLGAKLHPGGRPLLGPLLATLLFLLVWAGSHARTGGLTGIVPQKAFPAVIGVYTFAVVRYGPTLQRRMARFFERRDRVPVILRALVTLAIPTVVSLLITNQERVSDTAQKEQFVVLIGLVLAYFMLSPRGGDVAAAGRRLMTGAPS